MTDTTWKLTPVSCKYGAPMGREDSLPDDPEDLCILVLTPLQWVDGDYTEDGTYWGAVPGETIYCAHNEEGVEIFVRASSLEDAKEQILEEVPNAELVLDANVKPAWPDLPEFERGYFTCIFFMSDNDVGSGEYSNAEYRYQELHPANFTDQMEDCRLFQEKAKDLLEQAYEHHGYDADRAGNDFAYTRNGAGVGFWDRKEILGKGLGRRLTDIAEKFIEVSASFNEEGTDGRTYTFIE
jgi:hypothetical protein